MNPTIRTLIVWVAIFVVVILLWNTFQAGRLNRQEISFTDLLQDIEPHPPALHVALIEHVVCPLSSF